MKTKEGGPGHLVPKKRTFWGRHKFLADYVAGGPKIWPDEKKNVGLAGIFKDFLFESKTKKLCHFKVSQFEFFEKQGWPPLKRTLT